jgi:hypothetical protein
MSKVREWARRVVCHCRVPAVVRVCAIVAARVVARALSAFERLHCTGVDVYAAWSLEHTLSALERLHCTGVDGMVAQAHVTYAQTIRWHSKRASCLSLYGPRSVRNAT